MSNLASYSPEDVTVSIAGIQITGFVDGTFISIRREDPAFTTRVSADGMVSRTQSNNEVVSVDLTLMSTSAYNDLLSTIYLADRVSHLAKFPFYIKDTLGSTLLFSGVAWVSNVADVEFSTDVTSRVWEIQCAQATMFVGGNRGESSILQDLAVAVGGALPAGFLR